MRWSKSILKCEQAESVILEFVPQKFNLGTPLQALEYLSEKKTGSDFRMNDVSRVQTGVDQIEESNEEQRVEEKSLEKLKSIQETAYAEAYKLGLDEGKKVAFEKSSQEINSRMSELDVVLNKIKQIKTEMMAQNEAHFIRLVFQIASRIAMETLEEKPDAIITVIRQAALEAQQEENVKVQVSSKQFVFIEEMKHHTGQEYDFLKKIRFEPNEKITSGGCIVETNYGEVDARVEQRLEQLWKGLYQQSPKVKDVLSR